jgi:preprotein translocase subunit SecE
MPDVDVIGFLKEAKAELFRVVWPTKSQMIRDTVVVFVISIATAIFLGALDAFFEGVAKRFLF